MAFVNYQANVFLQNLAAKCRRIKGEHLETWQSDLHLLGGSSFVQQFCNFKKHSRAFDEDKRSLKAKKDQSTNCSITQ